MTIISNYILPHPPIVIDSIGKKDIEKCEKTREAMKFVSEEIKALSPDTIIVVTPHGTVFSDAVTINYFENLYGNLGDFGHSDISLEKKNNISLVEKIYTESRMKNISIAKLDQELCNRFSIKGELDHGVIVPLYFLNQIYSDFKLVHINYGGLSSDEHYKFGMAIQNACNSIDEKIVLIASGDLSHKLSNKGPYSFAKEGPIFDEKLIEYLDEKKTVELVTMDNILQKKAGECGKRSIDTLLGTLEGYDYNVKVLSYQGPFGVGYGVVSFNSLVEDDERELYSQIINKKKEINIKRKENEDAYVRLARKTIEEYVNNNRRLKPEALDLLEEMKKNRAGVFVSIKNASGLRGCIGTTGTGVSKNIANEIIRNAIEAATKDPRFPAIEPWELEDLKITVDVLHKSEAIESKEALDPNTYGVIVTSGHKRGLLLPNLEGVETVEQQLSIALRKAGISEDEDYSVEKFKVIRHY
ncbi:MAG TPA: AmmeMemoRadiSam system protein A [Clostridia bacterium]|nr:AmmeMemoRadiSam system protein A [Clostridia bacterium]